jgi:hypothetical protein
MLHIPLPILVCSAEYKANNSRVTAAEKTIKTVLFKLIFEILKAHAIQGLKTSMATFTDIHLESLNTGIM